VDLVQSDRAASSPALIEPLLADAARRAEALDIDTVVAGEQLRRRGFQAAAAVLVLLALIFAAREPARQAVDAASLAIFPERVRLDVTPGSARIKAGSPFHIEARLVGNRAPVVAQVQVENGDTWRSADMKVSPDGMFHLALESVTASFKYRVA